MRIRKEGVTVIPAAGQDITDAIREAVVLSVESRCPVTLVHNDTPILIDAQPLIEEAWSSWTEQREALR